MLVYPSAIDCVHFDVDLPDPTALRAPDAIGSRWRKLPAGRQALLALAHLRCGHTYARLAAGFGVGMATVYRHIREAIELLATLAPDLATAMRTAATKAYLILDGTLVRIDRLAADRPYYFRQTQTPRGQPADPDSVSL